MTDNTTELDFGTTAQKATDAEKLPVVLLALDQCKNSSVALDVPALTLGVQNLLVTSDAAMDADALQALETAATDAGVENLTVHAADRFETDRVSG